MRRTFEIWSRDQQMRGVIIHDQHPDRKTMDVEFISGQSYNAGEKFTDVARKYGIGEAVSILNRRSTWHWKRERYEAEREITWWRQRALRNGFTKVGEYQQIGSRPRTAVITSPLDVVGASHATP